MDAPDWLDEIRLQPGPPFATMGTHLLALDQWLLVDERRSVELARKELLLQSSPIVFAAQNGAEAAAAELLDLVRNWLQQHGVRIPSNWSADEHGEQHEHGERGECAEHPLKAAARIVQEDLALMQRIDGRWVLTAGAICFPTLWTIGEKIGLTLDRIHAPVAHYESDLAERVDRFHDRLTQDRPIWRRNWFVVPTNELHLPASGNQMRLGSPIAHDGSPMWIRSERQTLRRLPDSGAVVFTIRVQQAPLGVLRDRPDLAAKMLIAIRSWDVEKRLYTSTGGALDELIEWLDEVAT